MNDRIQKLARQAGLEIPADTEFNGHIHRNALEKFAQLIVRECMDVVDPGENQLIARFQARQWLSEHFGVEE